MATQHVTELLNAYHDGELRGRKLDQVASHLAHCPECQQALAELDALSALLQSDPLPQISTTPEQFVAQVGLRLPRQTQASHPGKVCAGVWVRRWMLMPVGVMVMIWFVQAVSTGHQPADRNRMAGDQPQCGVLAAAAQINADPTRC